MSQCRRFLKAITAIGLIIVAGCGAICATSQAAEPMVEYFKVSDGKLEPGKVKAYSYFEVEKGGRIYVFISPKAKEEFEKSGKPGKSPVTGIGFGPNGETVVFESKFAQKEYETRHTELNTNQ
ncbi:MAG TPA: hypothetical protein VI728_06025 [Syntrophales bacterium]|nr:hypothetical protein [Syntrophales bacterium]